MIAMIEEKWNKAKDMAEKIAIEKHSEFLFGDRKEQDKLSILDEAKTITDGDRALQYGRPENNFQRIADYWNVYIKHKIDKLPRWEPLKSSDFITPLDVAFMMSLMKQAREDHQHGRDNLTDICGYTRCASRILGEES